MTIPEYEEYERLSPEEYQNIRSVINSLTSALSLFSPSDIDVALHESEGYAIISVQCYSISIHHEDMDAFCDMLGKIEWFSARTDGGEEPMICSFLVKLNKK